MKISPKINGRNYHQKNLSAQQNYSSTNNNVTAPKNNVSFGGLKSGLVDIMDFIERKGFFAEFLIVDAISMIIPRVAIGLGRDKDKTGKLNYKAGAEEAGREMLSGPSMFLIPLGIFQAVKHYKPASNIPKDTLKELSATMDNVVNDLDAKTFNSKEKLNKGFADKIFDRAFGKFDIEKKAELKSKFTELLSNADVKDKTKFKESMQEFEKLIVTINNKNKTEIPLNIKSLKLDKTEINAKVLFEDFKLYSNDVIEKFTKQNFAKNAVENCKNEAKTFLSNVQKNRSLSRLGASMTSFFAVGAFLIALPKLYQISKTSPAMDSAKRATADALAMKGGANENN